MLGKNPRLLAALDLAAEKSGWGQPLPARVGRGVCVQPSFGSFIATVVEAEVDSKARCTLRRIISAVDTGIAVNPDTVEGAARRRPHLRPDCRALWRDHHRKGRVQQSNFNDYRMLRIDEMPAIEVHRHQERRGAWRHRRDRRHGRPPALRNAIFAATGMALRRLPIEPTLLAAGKTA